MCVKNAGLSLDFGSLDDRIQQFDFFADLLDFTINPRISFAGMRENATIELLRTKAGL
jgi:hypothetical protein